MKVSVNEVFKRKFLIVFVFLVVLGFGIYSYIVIPKQEMPEIDTPFMTIYYTVPGVSAIDIEETVIEDAEQVILTYQEVTEVRSTIYDNFAYMTVMFSYSVNDPIVLSEEIFEKIQSLSLNEQLTDISYISEYDDPHIIYSLHSDSMSDEELYYSSLRLKNTLLSIDQIKTIEITSSFEEKIEIILDPGLMSTYGLTIDDIYGIIYSNTLNIPFGGIDTGDGFISISGEDLYSSLNDISNIVIIPAIPTVSPVVLLSDIGEIEIIGNDSLVYNYEDETSTFLSIYFNDDIDFTKMTDIMNSEIDSFLSVEDTELSISKMLFLPDYVGEQIDSVFMNLVIAILVVMFVVLLGIGVRNSLLIIITIPVIVFGTIGILNLLDYELHKLTIVGLIVAIGIMVDNSIVITESIKRHLESGESKLEASKNAVLNNFTPVLSSTLTTIAAFIVIVMLPGFLGEIVKSMPLTVIITISLSFIVAMTLSPVIAMLALKPQAKRVRKEKQSRLLQSMDVILHIPYIWVILSFILFGVSGYFAFVTQPLDLYPNDEQRILYIDYESATQNDLPSTIALRDEILLLIEKEDKVIDTFSSVGGNLPQFHFSAKTIPSVLSNGRIFMTLDMTESEILSYKETLESEMKEIDGSVSVHVIELSPPIAPLRVTISGDDLDLVTSKSDEIFAEISELSTVKNAFIVSNSKGFKYSISYNQDLMSSAFISKAEIDQVISLNLNGYSIDMIGYETVVRTDLESVEEISGLVVTSSVTDISYPLSTFITFEPIVDYTVIQRYNDEFVSYIDLDYSNTSNLSLLENDVRGVIDDYSLNNLSITYGGENELFTEISGDLIRASVIAVLLIFFIMFIQFNDFIKPLIVLLTIPLSFTGSFLFLIIFQSPITATALIGMVSLLGVTVNTGILLVEYISREVEKGYLLNVAIKEALRLRFRPIILTSFTTILGLIPLLLNGGNFFKPLAITFMGGMITSTLMTLIVIPSAYKLIYNNNKETT